MASFTELADNMSLAFADKPSMELPTSSSTASVDDDASSSSAAAPIPPPPSKRQRSMDDATTTNGNEGEGSSVVSASSLNKANISRWTSATGHTFLGLTELEGQEKWQGPFHFATLADTQLGAIEDNTVWDDEVELCRKAVNHINRLKPKFAIVCGDLVNHVPIMYPESDPEIRTRQVNDFKEVMSGIDASIPLLCVCGNHDVSNSPSAITLERYRSEFGDDYFGFWVGGIRGIVINSNLYYDPSAAKEEYERQHAWLEAEFASARAAGATHIILFGHHPLFLVRDDEEEDIDLLGNLSFTTKRGAHVTIPNTYFHIPRERRELILHLMKDNGSTHVFCGHWHQNSVVRSEKYGVENVTTSAVGMQLGSDDPGFRLVKVFSDTIVHRYFSFDKMPDAVSLDCQNKEAW